MKNLVIYFRGDYDKKYGNNAFFNIPEKVKNGFIDFLKDFKYDYINTYM